MGTKRRSQRAEPPAGGGAVAHPAEVSMHFVTSQRADFECTACFSARLIQNKVKVN